MKQNLALVNSDLCRSGIGKLRPVTNFCVARKSLNQIIKKLIKFHKNQITTIL